MFNWEGKILSFNNKSVAYDLSLFEESKNKNNIVRLPKKSYNKKTKINSMHAIALGAICVLGVGIFGTFVYNQVQLTELTSKICIGEKALSESESIYTQLQVKAESKMSLSVIENYAIDKMEMTKLDPSQIEYINLPVNNNLSEKNNNKSWKLF